MLRFVSRHAFSQVAPANSVSVSVNKSRSLVNGKKFNLKCYTEESAMFQCHAMLRCKISSNLLRIIKMSTINCYGIKYTDQKFITDYPKFSFNFFLLRQKKFVLVCKRLNNWFNVMRLLRFCFSWSHTCMVLLSDLTRACFLPILVVSSTNFRSLVRNNILRKLFFLSIALFQWCSTVFCKTVWTHESSTKH